MKQEMMLWQWHQLDNMQIVCTYMNEQMNTSTPSLDFFNEPDALPATQPTVSKF